MTHEAIEKPRPELDPGLSPLKRAFLALESSQRRVAALEGAAREPIAIIGMSCRTPGAENIEELWRLLRGGVDAITEIPADRFSIDDYFDPNPETPGRIATRYGGFLKDIDKFDCGFFGIAPREAQGVDPQQRLLLEVSWEALEHAGQAPARLENSKTGVYFGLCTNDYSYLQVQSGDVGLLDAHFGSGVAHSVAAGRLSYLLGLQGPSLAVDTACSSSLVAIHLACQALRSGDCDMAITGGVNLILGPDIFVALSHSRMLAPDGRCKTFSAEADGFARGEGCGVLVLKRLAAAQADGDRVLAVIRGSAVNQDGPSGALTAPNGPAQESVIRTALERAGVAPRQVGYIEAHGTGTQLGDPLEMHALGGVFAPERDASTPLWVGSLKTNVGHLEGAAGVTGLIKLVLSLQHQQIPEHLHMRTPSPHIDWATLPIKTPDRLVPWAPIEGRRIAGVSAFGFSGTNAHIVVEEAPARAAAPDGPRAPRAHLFALSARDGEDLSRKAASFAATIYQSSDRDLGDLCHTANFGRSHFAERATILCRGTGELTERLLALSRGEETAGLNRNRLAKRDRPRVAFVFTGQGSQYGGMARRLHVISPVFRSAFDRCAGLLSSHLPRPLGEVVFDPDAAAGLNNTLYAQPALFAVEYALTQAWASFGVAPSIVAGHSVGEIVAATVAGVLSLEDGAKLVARRGALMAALPAGGAMAAVNVSEAEALAAIAAQGGSLAIAAVNGPERTVVSGATAEVAAVCEVFARGGVRCERLPVSHAFHSPLMDPILDDFESGLAALSFVSPQLQLVSNLTGRVAGAKEIAEPRYWRRHLRETVRFSDCVATIAAMKPDCVVEIGPHPTLLSFFGEAAPQGARLAASLRKGRDDWEQFLASVSELFLAGADIDWRGADCGEPAAIVDLPTYPFRRQRHWFEAKPQTSRKAGRPGGEHPLLGRVLASPLPQKQFEARLSASAPPYLDDHRVRDVVILPAAAGFEMGQAAAAAVFGSGAHTVEDVVIREAMAFDEGERIVQTIVEPIADGAARFSIQSQPESGGHWRLHFEGRLRADAAETKTTPAADLAAIAARCRNVSPQEGVYARLAQRGVALGPAFQVVREMGKGDGEGWVRFELGDPMRSQDGYKLHPILLDAGLQSVVAALPEDFGDGVYLPVGVRRFRVFSTSILGGVAHAVLDPRTRSGAPMLQAEVRLFNDEGGLVAAFEGLEFQRISAGALARDMRRAPDHWFFQRVWRPAPALAASGRSASAWVILADRGGVAAALAKALRARGDACAEPFNDAAEAGAFWRRQSGRAPGVVDLRWLDLAAESSERPYGEALQSLVGDGLSLLRTLTQESGERRLWVVTRGAQAVGEVHSPLSPLASAAWGLTWSAALEHPDLRAVCVDLDPASQADEIARLAGELDQDGREDKVAFRDGQRMTAQLRQLAQGAPAKPIHPEPVYALQSTKSGTADGVVLAAANRCEPAPGEVEIRVQATGLNFRDVLAVLNLYPGEVNVLGGECCGEIVRLGPGVGDLKVGDRVVAIAAGCFASHVIAKRDLTQTCPDAFSAEEAAALPIAYLTAAYALVETAAMKRGDRVLIHAAAGGVGLASVHLALRAGAEIFATAGSEAKRARLRSLGVHHVLSSRDESFAKVVLELTNGEGVDVVLNSLSGSFIDATFRATAKRGRFVEIGKRGVWTPEQAAALGRGIEYAVIDLNEWAEREPNRVGPLFSRLMAEIASGALPKLPVTCFPLDDVASAFQHMMKARHIGKIVVAHKPVVAGPLVCEDADYLVTGGLSGIGLQAAEWLIERGAKHLCLIGRRGRETPGTADIVRRFAEAGASVLVEKIDVGDFEALHAFLAERAAGRPPLRGVLHAAGIIDDAVIASQDWPRFDSVFRPKVGGAQNLDVLTRTDPLDWFVLFSSIASLMGSPGQANYAAANTVLDLMAHERRRVGRPALSVDWGAWGDVGLASGAALRQRLAANGMTALPRAPAFGAMEKLIESGGAQAGVAAVDWGRFLARRETGSHSSYFDSAAMAGPRREFGVSEKAGQSIRERLALVAPARRGVVLRKYVRDKAFKVLGVTAADGPAGGTPLSEAGLDSLLAVELRNVIGRELQLSLPATLLFDYPTIDALSEQLNGEIHAAANGADEAKPSVSSQHADSSAMLAQIDQMSDEEVEALLGSARG